jgi:mRNA interferase HigB
LRGVDGAYTSGGPPQAASSKARSIRESRIYFLQYSIDGDPLGISRKIFFDKAAKYADARTALQVWLETAKEAEWKSLEDIRRAFPATDMLGPLAIFNIKGNTYRLIVRMVFSARKIYVKEFLTHAEYSKDRWKKWL